uniref:Uncharacterized protein n=1 Tax=Timema shepardi TaxID=629360 RepID=A0A7R9B2E9_TIMSH|nr:unnamed protein product [Timema shepardi]
MTLVIEDNDNVSNLRESDDDEEMDAEETAGPSHSDAYETIQTAMNWLERQPEGTAKQLVFHNRLRDVAAKKPAALIIINNDIENYERERRERIWPQDWLNRRRNGHGMLKMIPSEVRQVQQFGLKIAFIIIRSRADFTAALRAREKPTAGQIGRGHTESNAHRQRNKNAMKTAVARVEHIELNVTVYTAGNERKTATQLLGNSRTTSFPGTAYCKLVYQVPTSLVALHLSAKPPSGSGAQPKKDYFLVPIIKEGKQQVGNLPSPPRDTDNLEDEEVANTERDYEDVSIGGEEQVKDNPRATLESNPQPTVDQLRRNRKQLKRKTESDQLDPCMSQYFQSKLLKNSSSESLSSQSDERFLLSLKGDLGEMNPRQKRRMGKPSSVFAFVSAVDECKTKWQPPLLTTTSRKLTKHYFISLRKIAGVVIDKGIAGVNLIWQQRRLVSSAVVCSTKTACRVIRLQLKSFRSTEVSSGAEHMRWQDVYPTTDVAVCPQKPANTVLRA